MEQVGILEALLNNPEGVTFTALFVTLLVYVMRKNDEREKNYRDTIKELTTALNNFEDLKQKVDSIIKKWE
jgi:predicted nucleic acid-binding protein